MRSLRLEQVLVSACAALATLLGASGQVMAQECPALEVINCGHRGTGTNADENAYAENTVPSFLQAEAEGAQMVELDVVHSADGVLVVIHDDTVDRTTNGTGCVGDLGVTELQTLDAAHGTAAAGTDVTIPTLAEVLDAVAVDINIEIKINDTGACPDSDKPAMAADVVAAVAGDSKSRRIVVSSFDAEVLSEIRLLDAEAHLGLLTLDPGDAADALALGFDALNLLSLAAREDTIADIQSLGLDLAVWTENDPYRMQDHMLFGVNVVITDEPDLFESMRTEFCTAWQEEQQTSDGGCAASGRGDSDSGLVIALLLLALTRRPGSRVSVKPEIA